MLPSIVCGARVTGGRVLDESIVIYLTQSPALSPTPFAHVLALSFIFLYLVFFVTGCCLGP